MVKDVAKIDYGGCLRIYVCVELSRLRGRG